MTIAVLLLKNPIPLEQWKKPAQTNAADSSMANFAARQAAATAGMAQAENDQGAVSREKSKPSLPADEHPPALRGESKGAIPAAAATGGMPGKLFITCEPWAEVFIDSVRVDATPLQDTLRVFPGTHELMLRHPDYPSYRQILRIQPRQSLRVAVNLDTLFGFIDLRIYPWAEVWLDGVQRGQTPFGRPLTVEAGSHLLRLHHPQYGDVQDYISVTKSETTRFTMNLSQLAGKRN